MHKQPLVDKKNSTNPTPMKVLAVVSTKTNINIVRPEAEQFITMHQMGIRVDIICDRDSEYAERFLAANMKIVGEYPKNKKDAKATAAIRSLLISEKYDILHALHRKSIACGIRAAKDLPVKIVAYRGSSGLYWHDPTAYQTALNPRVDKVICVCNDIKRQLSKQLFFDKSKAITIYKGHRMEWYKNIPKADLSELNIPKDAFVIACPANNRKWKGIPTFLNAINLLPKSANIHLLLIGMGMDTPFYVKKINENQNRDKIHTLGFRNDILSILSASHVVMQTSYKNEGLSRSTIEAMSQGVVPIVTDAGGNPELVIDKQCGLVVPVRNAKAMADAILQLYSDNTLYSQLSRAAIERIKNDFTIEKTARETINV